MLPGACFAIGGRRHVRHKLVEAGSNCSSRGSSSIPRVTLAFDGRKSASSARTCTPRHILNPVTNSNTARRIATNDINRSVMASRCCGLALSLSGRRGRNMRHIGNRLRQTGAATHAPCRHCNVDADISKCQRQDLSSGELCWPIYSSARDFCNRLWQRIQEVRLRHQRPEQVVVKDWQA